MIEFKDVMEVFNSINQHHGIYPTNPYKTNNNMEDDYFSDGISIPTKIMPMFRLEFTDQEIPQLVAVSYKIDYLNPTMDNNEKNNSTNVDESVDFNEFVIYKMNDEFIIDDKILHQHYPNHLTLNKKDMVNCLYSQAIALTSGLSFDTVKQILDNDNEVSRTLNASLDNPVVSLKQLSMLALKQFMYDHSKLNNEHEVSLTLVPYYHDIKSKRMKSNGDVSDGKLDNIYYEQSNKSYLQCPELTKILTVKPANIEMFIQPKHTSNHYQMQIKHPELFEDGTDGQYLSNISMIVTNNFPDKTQKQLTIDNDYYVTVVNVLKQEYDMSWKTIDNMVEKQVNNGKLQLNQKEKIKHG